jgi:hypothetical protein
VRGVLKQVTGEVHRRTWGKRGEEKVTSMCRSGAYVVELANRRRPVDGDSKLVISAESDGPRWPRSSHRNTKGDHRGGVKLCDRSRLMNAVELLPPLWKELPDGFDRFQGPHRVSFWKEPMLFLLP